MGAGMGARVSMVATGLVVDRWHTYTPILWIAGLLPMVATAVLFTLGGPIRRLPFENRS